jgi:hypothetical protein
MYNKDEGNEENFMEYDDFFDFLQEYMYNLNVQLANYNNRVKNLYNNDENGDTQLNDIANPDEKSLIDKRDAIVVLEVLWRKHTGNFELIKQSVSSIDEKNQNNPIRINGLAIIDEYMNQKSKKNNSK